MKKKLFIILGVLVLSTSLLLSFTLKKEDNINKKGISKVEKIFEKPAGVQAYTLNGEKTDLLYDALINGYEINSITCRNGTIATYNKTDNSINLSNIHMPDYCTMDFKGKEITIYDKLLADNPTLSARFNFGIFTDDTTGTLFMATESIAGSTAKDVYYYAGNTTNNWIYFGEYYWRIIRTNHDESIRLLYVGTSPDTTQAYIGKSAYWNNDKSPRFVGYMYGTGGINETLSSIRANTTDSHLKEYIENWYDGTRTRTNTAYQKEYTDPTDPSSNKLIDYSDYLSLEAVYCNDRSAPSYNLTEIFYFGSANRTSPTYDCESEEDAFSVLNESAQLKYPIGLMTADEIKFAGGSGGAWYGLNSLGEGVIDFYWWLMSPYRWYYFSNWGDTSKNALSYRVLSSANLSSDNSAGTLSYTNVNSGSAVRPVISIKGDTLWSKGDGSPENPYEIVYN